jgi:hypothetical protein
VVICRNNPVAKATCQLLFPAGTWTVGAATSADRYTVSRGHRIYASGRLHMRRGHRARLRLEAGTRLPPGRYILTIIAGNKHHQRVLMRQTIQVV